MARIFIDGQAGTTGLELSERLARRDDVELLTLDDSLRKDPAARAERLEDADVAVLCLPDDAARQAAEMAAGKCRVLDASTAHRTAEGWVYGCPELAAEQREKIAGAERVTNPGCYPQGFLLLVKPLIDAGLLDPETRLSVFGLSGYSGGGRALIETYEGFDAAEAERRNTRSYGLSLNHKHVPEMLRYSGLRHAPLFRPSVGNYYRGMLIEVPIFTSMLEGGAGLDTVHERLAARYAGEPFVRVAPPGAECLLEGGFLDATAQNDTNEVMLMVFGNQEQLLLTARYDNLGKGAAGAALQNLNLMLGCDERLGLTA